MTRMQKLKKAMELAMPFRPLHARQIQRHGPNANYIETIWKIGNIPTTPKVTVVHVEWKNGVHATPRSTFELWGRSGGKHAKPMKEAWLNAISQEDFNSILSKIRNDSLDSVSKMIVMVNEINKLIN